MSGSGWVLWGFKPGSTPNPVKITGGSLRDCRTEQKYRTGHGWTCGIYEAGTAPAGLRDQAREQQ